MLLSGAYSWSSFVEEFLRIPKMKKLFLSALCFLSVVSYASHYAGGDLQYVYIGDSTGVSHQYEFILRLYRDVSGVAMPNTVDMRICSSCNPTLTITLVQTGPAKFAPTLFDCVDPTEAGTVEMEVYEYRQVAVLPGLCSDYKFVTESLFDRNYVIDNLNLNSGSQALVITASLNNTLGNNSSPKFVSEPVRAFCINQHFNWQQTAIEEDGDSLFFRLIKPKGAGGTCDPTEYLFEPGWSHTNPISIVAGTAFTINEKTGLISFTPSSIEIDVLAVAIDEFRYDTTFFQWIKVGQSTRDMQITVSANCKQEVKDGVELDFNYPGIYPDPVSGLPTVDYKCLDSSVTLKFATKLDCSTISPDATDFRLTSPTGQPIPIKHIFGNCDYNNEATELKVKLHKPLSINGKYWLYSKIGNDANTLLNKCGFPMDELDTIQLNVTGCFEMQMDLKNVTIEDDLNPKVEWKADTSSFPTYLFDKMMVYRKAPNGPFQHIGDVFDVNKEYYIDLQITHVEVDQLSYEYKVEMMLNGQAMGKTRGVHSILLEVDAFQCDTLNLNWNVYDGWSNPVYTVQIGEDDGSGNYVWTDHQSASNPTSSTSYTMINSLQPGSYKVRVKTNDPQGVYTSYSNWMDCLQENPPAPDDVVVPNVMTPNGDGVNDNLIIENIEMYADLRSVQIFNRWGKQVYSTNLYTNSIPFNGLNSSGKPLADGVYFIVVELYDRQSAKEFKLNSTLTVMNSLDMP